MCMWKQKAFKMSCQIYDSEYNFIQKHCYGISFAKKSVSHIFGNKCKISITILSPTMILDLYLAADFVGVLAGLRLTK